MGTKGRKPAMLFYPRDWLADPALNVCSLCAQGLWLRMICYMWESEKRGYLMVNDKALHKAQVCRLVGAGNSEDEVLYWMEELANAGVYSVTDKGVIYCRRMVDDQGLEDNIKAKNKRNEKKSSPRASTRFEDDIIYKRKTEIAKALREGRLGYDRLPGFQKFWAEYPPRNGVRANKQEAAVSWVWLRLECMTEQIVRSLVSLKETHDWKKDGGKFVPMATTFLNKRRWEDEVEEYEPRAWKPTVEKTG